MSKLIQLLTRANYSFIQGLLINCRFPIFLNYIISVLITIIPGRGFHSGVAALASAKKFVFAQRFQGLPKLEDIKLVEEELPQLANGGITVIKNLIN